MPAPYTSPSWSSCRAPAAACRTCLWRRHTANWASAALSACFSLATSLASRMLMVNSEGCSSMVSISSAKKRFPRLNLHTAVATAESIRLLPTNTVLGQCAQIMLFKDSLFWVFPCNTLERRVLQDIRRYNGSSCCATSLLWSGCLREVWAVLQAPVLFCRSTKSYHHLDNGHDGDQCRWRCSETGWPR